jgi:hypothetical protein
VRRTSSPVLPPTFRAIIVLYGLAGSITGSWLSARAARESLTNLRLSRRAPRYYDSLFRELREASTVRCWPLSAFLEIRLPDHPSQIIQSEYAHIMIHMIAPGARVRVREIGNQSRGSIIPPICPLRDHLVPSSRAAKSVC